MLATLADPVDEQGWIYEIKWDGYRAITLKNGHIIKILSRNNKSYNEKYSVVFESLQNWDIQAILDGEIVVLDKNGLPDFGALQNWKGTNDGDLVYYLFDIMWWKGYDLTQVPLLERRKLLEKLVPGKNPILRLSERINSKPSLLLKSIAKMGLEGIMAKQADSLYTPGVRSKAWLKMKVNQRHEVVIGGFTQNEGTSKTFSSLLVGLYRRGHLHYTGKIGTGFSVNLQLEIMGKMKPLIRKSSPFAESIDINHPSRFNSAPPHAKVTWLKPVLVAEVSYREMTADGVMRHPSFEGLRDDKEAKDVHEEIKLRKQTQPIKKIKRKKS